VLAYSSEVQQQRVELLVRPLAERVSASVVALTMR
jgi:hypothetical protein